MGLDKKVGFITNYFVHLWEDPEKARAIFSGKRPLAGPHPFTHARTIHTIKEGLDAGLKLAEPNPIRATLTYIQMANKYLTAHAIMNEMDKFGFAKVFGLGKAPSGWTKILDPIAQRLVGHVHAPDAAAQVINNLLSPGITGPYKTAYELWRKGGNILNMAQLSLSAFHLTYTAIDSMASGVALGAKQLSEGRVLKGAGQIARSVSPTRPIEVYLRGRKAIRGYLDASTLPSSQLGKTVDAITRAGGRVTMDKFYTGTEAGSFWRSLRVGTAGQEIVRAYKDLGPIKGTANFLGRAIQTIAAPLMEDVVPKLKMGVFTEMAQDVLKEKPHLSPEELDTHMQKIWDSVDNRLGQLVYDNLFWNKTQKQILMATTRAVGWNLGTIREVGGGILDMAKLLDSGEMTYKASYVIGLTATTALYGAMYQYLKTGKAPENLEDLFKPQTGGKNKDGTPERVMLPTVMKDVLNVAAAPEKTVAGKVNPLVTAVTEMRSNEDYRGAQIFRFDLATGKAEPIVEQLRDAARYLSNQFTPIGVSKQIKADPSSKISPFERFFGLNPPPRSLDPDIPYQPSAEQIRAYKARVREDLQQ
jgi:hypothetical protein